MVKEHGDQVSLAQSVKAWGIDSEKYRDTFLYGVVVANLTSLRPRAEKKWEKTDVFSIEEKLFRDLEAIDAAMRRTI